MLADTGRDPPRRRRPDHRPAPARARQERRPGRRGDGRRSPAANRHPARPACRRRGRRADGHRDPRPRTTHRHRRRPHRRTPRPAPPRTDHRKHARHGAPDHRGTTGAHRRHDRVRQPAKLAAHAGLAPVSRDSGTVSGNHRQPRRYHRRLRHIL
ncbi:transposase [Micromonospora tulbaghiae]